MMIWFYLGVLVLCGRSQTLYNHNSWNSYRNQTWMSLFDDGIPLRYLNILGTHSSMAQGTWGDAFQTQSLSLLTQLESGIRALDIRCRHYSDAFYIHERMINLGVQFNDVLNVVQGFLTSYPNQVVLIHVVEEHNPSGNSRSFEGTFISYKNSYSNLIWEPTTQNPTLGMTRGKVVIIQNFNGNSIHGLLYNSFNILGHKHMGTNWDLYDRWLSIKSALSNSNSAGSSYLSFWTGSIGSFPYFVASGKSSPQNGAPRLATGLTTPGFKSYYPDFPRVACFIGICTIAFEGMNILGYNYITGNSLNYVGIVFTDFFGDSLVQKVVNLNSNLFGVCSQNQVDQGCTVCTVAGTCLACDQENNYVYDAGSSSCPAAVGYYLNATFFPQPCNEAIIGCEECSSETVCTKCDTYANYQLSNDTCVAAPSYYLDANSIPIKCSITGCYLCSDETTCTQCSSANNFAMDGSGNCICNATQNLVASGDICVCNSGYYLSNGSCVAVPICPSSGSGCSSCSGSVCSSCDSGWVAESTYCVCESGKYFDGADCLQCNTTQLPCLSCQSSSLCTSCVNNFTLVQGQCECADKHYPVDLDTCHRCMDGCLSCVSASVCDKCDENNSFILVGSVCQCEKGKYVQNQVCVPCGTTPGCIACDMNGCIQCQGLFGFHLNGTICQCSPGYYISTMNVCTACPQEGCTECDSDTICTNCTAQYYLQGAQCKQVCGDGKLFNLACDDGNTVDGDGCSSNCEVQADYTCVGGSSITPSGCSFSGTISITLSQLTKQQQSNKVMMKMVLEPALASFQDINFDEAVTTNFPYKSRTITYNSDTGQLGFEFDYDTSLNTKQMEVTFDPPDTPQFFYTATSKVALPYSTDNNLSLKYYDEQVYDLWPTMVTLTQVLLYFSLCVFLLCFLFVSKLMAVEMILVLQVAFVALMIVDKIQALLSPLIYLWPINGYNRIIRDSSGVVPARVSTLGYKDYFLANFNLTLVFVVLPLVVGVVLYLVGKFKDKKNLRKLGARAMKQYFISFLLFAQLQIVVAVCLACMYGVDTAFGIVFGILLLLGLAILSVILPIKPANFGEYKQFFKRGHKVQSNYYVVVIVMRLLIGAGIVALNQSNGCAYFTLAVCLLQCILLVVIRPYLYNFRPIMNSIVILLTVVLYSLYRLSITDNTAWLTTYLPLFFISILFVTVVVNCVLMVIQLMRICRDEKEKEDEEKGSVFKEEEKKWKLLQKYMIINSPQNGQNREEYVHERMILHNLKDFKLEPGTNQGMERMFDAI